MPRVEVAQPGLDMGKHVVACKIAADDVERRAHEQGERLCWKFRSFVCKHGHAMLFEHAVEHASVLVLIAAENGDLPVAQTLFPYETADLLKRRIPPRGTGLTQGEARRRPAGRETARTP